MLKLKSILNSMRVIFGIGCVVCMLMVIGIGELLGHQGAVERQPRDAAKRWHQPRL